MIKNLKFIANLEFAIILLLFISITITIGSIVEQDKSLEFYQQNYPEKMPLFGFLTWKLINFIGIDHIYRTFWFISLLIFFGLSLIACTFLQQLPILKFSRRCNFNKPQILNIQTLLKQQDIGRFLNRIICKGYFVYQQKTNFYANRGLIGRISPIFVHLSILLILFGSIIASICGFNNQELIATSEIFHLQNNIISGPLSNFSQQSIRINDFWINYYKDNKIKQFYSNLSILDGTGKEIINKTISVNKPLIYKNLTLYQTDWTIVGLRIKKDNIFFQLPLLLSENLNNKIWLTWLPLEYNLANKSQFGKLIIINNYKQSIFLYDLKGNLEREVDIHDFLFNKNYKFIDLIGSTGLQIKSDPGVFFIYSGFGFLMISTFLSYICFFQIWIFINLPKNKKQLWIGSKTNRSPFSLNFEFFKLTKNL